MAFLSSPELAVSASFTADPLQDTLDFWMRELRLAYELRFAPYNQVFQQLLDPNGLLARNRSGVNAVLVRFDDWLRYHNGRPDPHVEENARHLVDAVRAAAGAMPAPLIVCICPSRSAFAAVEELVRAGLKGLPSVHLITPSVIGALYPLDRVHDPHADELGHVPYTPEFFAVLATVLARKVCAIRTAPYKVIALDCDDTLWSGICGEDGPAGVVIDPPRRALQEFMAAQRAAGMLLCLCTKNNEEDVLETFRAHPDMPLGMGDFVARRVNWDSKGANLAGLAAELGLGLDSFILIDDNPKECTEVQADCPDVLALALPPNPEEIPDFLNHVWAFDRARITEEDRQRSAMYGQQAERAKLQRSASSLEEFLAQLRLEVRIAPAVPEQLPRLAQLTVRTNQMNLSAIRRTESEIAELVSSGAAECLAVDVSDRFGSYGLTGLAIFTAGDSRLVVDTFLLSCRVLGRGVEHRLLRRLGEIACQRGMAEVELPFVPAQRNRPALLFLESVGAAYRDGNTFRLPAAFAAGLVYKPAGSPPPLQAPASRKSAERPPIDYARIASELRAPGAILRAARNTQPPGARAGTQVRPRTALEAELAALWSELLHAAAVGAEDNFFDLGGHSLLAVQLLSRVRERYGAELSLELVYSGNFTVAELAKAIEVDQIEQSAGTGYSALIEEIDALSDDEVRELLAREQQDAAGAGD